MPQRIADMPSKPKFIVTYLTAAGRHGRCADVVLGYDVLAGYLASSPYFSVTIARYCNIKTPPCTGARSAGA
jgi:hypothetical protein